MSKASSQLVRYRSGKLTFEVLTKPGTVLQFREGRLGFGKVLAAEAVFTNASKGDLAAQKDLVSAFETSDVIQCCEIIVSKGELQVSAAERAAEQAQAVRAVVQYIHKNFVDPSTGAPHSTARIETAMKDCRIKVDPKKEAKRQGDEAVRKMAGTLTFRKAVALRATIFLKHAYVGSCTNLIQQNSTVLSQDWTSRTDGCIFSIECSKSELDSLISSLQKPTNGDFDFSLDSDAIAEREPEDTSRRGKKKKKKGRSKKGAMASSADESGTTVSAETLDSAASEGGRKKKKKKRGD